MKILIIPNNMTNNCYGLRNALPARFLEQRGHEVRIKNDLPVYFHKTYGKTIDPVDIDWADVVVFNRHYDVELPTLRNLMRYAKSEGKKVVYETDDLLETLDSSNPLYEDLKKDVAQVRMLAAEASLCTTTGPELAEELRKYNPNVKVLPNCVDPKQWTLRKGGNLKVRVGWAGGSSHMADLLMVIDTISELQKEIDFEFVIFGLVPTDWETYVKSLVNKHEKNLVENPGAKPADWYTKTIQLDDKLKSLHFRHQLFVPLTEYNSTLSKLNLDVGICPLVDTRFNRSKSAVKFYEYAMVGTATLASQIPPYFGEVGYTAKNKHDKWKNKLRTLITNKPLRQSISKEQREWVLANRGIESTIHLWADAYSST